jgi:hypothetical protein
MSGRTLVGMPAAGVLLLDLHLPAGGNLGPPLPLSHVQLTMSVDPSNGSATGGVLSGVLSLDDAIAWAHQMGGWVSSSFCAYSAFDSITQLVRQAAAILHDGTNEPGRPCDGISIGLGFDATAVQLGKVVTLPAVPDSCADAGADAAGE